MKKIDKTLQEVRRWKAKTSAKTRKMKPAEIVAYFRASAQETKAHKKRAA